MTLRSFLWDLIKPETVAPLIPPRLTLTEREEALLGLMHGTSPNERKLLARTAMLSLPAADREALVRDLDRELWRARCP